MSSLFLADLVVFLSVFTFCTSYTPLNQTQLSFFHKCILLNCLKSTSLLCYMPFSKKTNFSKEDKNPILLRASAIGRLSSLTEAATSSLISIILFSGLISFEDETGTMTDSFDIWDSAPEQPCLAGLPSLAAETLRAPARLSALYLVSESTCLSDGHHKFQGRQFMQNMTPGRSRLLFKSSFFSKF